jgi:hypothetical protein
MFEFINVLKKNGINLVEINLVFNWILKFYINYIFLLQLKYGIICLIMKNHLVGLYRKNKKIKSIYSTQNTYFDYNLKGQYCAQVIPLKCYTNSKSWTCSNYSNYLDSTTKSLLDKNTVWMSASEESSIFYALMYSPSDVLEMSRTGYLLVKLNNELIPVTVNIDNEEYLIEIKGLGSPIGGFPNTHLRNQAGCFNKAHIRITGGLFEKEAYSEFNYLAQKDTLFIEQGIGSHVKPLGVTTFKFLDFDFGVLLRLTPSSLRASFMKHPEFDRILSSRISKGYYYMGKCAATLLSSRVPLKHQNLSLNNMVYVETNNYDLTDWSEVQILFCFPEMLDYISCIFPILYFNYQLSLKELNVFLKGLNNVFNTNYYSFKNFNQSLKTHKKILMKHSAGFYNYICENGLDFTGVILNFQQLKSYFPPEYFSSSTQVWVSKYLIPSLVERREILNLLLDIRKRVPVDLKKDVLRFNITSATKQFLDPLFAKFPILKQLKSKKKTRKKLNEVVKEFTSSKKVLFEFLDDLDELVNHKQRILQINILLKELELIQSNSHYDYLNINDFLSFKLRPVPTNVTYLMYPYVLFIYSFLYSQIMFLESSKQGASAKERNHINRIIYSYNDLIKTCSKRPESLKTYFSSQSPKGLIERLSWC